MSYTFTSPIKNTNNKETLDRCSEIKRKIDKMFEDSKTILMIGWRSDSDSTFVKHMLDREKVPTIIEIFPKNLESVPTGITATCADIRDYKVDKTYDMLLWQHGPEHVTKLDIMKFFKEYGKMFKYIILESPNGPTQQGPMYGNPYEEHISSWTPTDYTDLGFEYITYAGQTNDAFILAYTVNENPLSS